MNMKFRINSQPYSSQCKKCHTSYCIPILFLVFIKDIPECIQSNARLIADDTIVYRTIEAEEDSRQLQNDLEALEEWEPIWVWLSIHLCARP